jgi:hypothetical protein
VLTSDVNWCSVLIHCRDIVIDIGALFTTATTTYHGEIIYPSDLEGDLIIGAVGAAIAGIGNEVDQDGLTSSYCAEIYLRSILHTVYNNLYKRKGRQCYVTAA